ncbi:MAG: universal stress protein [Proteobacteria bacterium]|nr:universal stress protein [Pseudomonadota bacterium]
MARRPAKIARILVALKDIRRTPAHVLGKVLHLAKGLNAEVCLFHALSDPVFINSVTLATTSLEVIEARAQKRAPHRLESLAGLLRRKGVTTTTRVDWDYPAHEAVIRATMSWAADLVIVDCYRTQHRAPWLLRFTDWELLRNCPVPVLLLKNRRLYARRPVLAAVDPLHAFAKPAKLDGEILSYASAAAAALRSPLHAVSAYNPLLTGMTPAELIAPGGIKRAQAAAADRARRSAEPELEQHGITQRRRHIVDHAPAAAIQQTAAEIDAQMVVMGAISRTGLKRLLVGNTAERALDLLECDVLVVKPPGFRPRVPRSSRGPQLLAVATIAGM